jgi:two-component system, sensor histidine kinase and response regulator
MTARRSTAINILLVEADRYVVRTVNTALGERTFQVQQCDSCERALELIEQRSPDLLIYGYSTSAMDSQTFISRVRAFSRTLPVILFTYLPHKEAQQLARELDVEDYVVKPIRPDELRLAVQSLLRRSQRMQEETNQQLDEMRSHIVGLLQHEFRTPLTFLIGYADYLNNLEEGTIDRKELSVAVKAILEGSQRLHELVEGFLMMADMAQQRLQPDQLEWFNATALWQGIYANRRESLAEAGLQIEEVELRQPVYAAGDSILTREALARLFDNAIRYRRPESAILRLEVVYEGDYVGWRITDDGCGIPADQLEQITVAFGRVPDTFRRQHGAGIGLAVVDQVARLHGGYLDVESTEGTGSTFTLWYPRLDDAIEQ